MASILSVPGPLKTLFDKFPLKTYGYVNNNDEAMEYEISQRSSHFEGPNAVKSSKDDVFHLGVYQIVRDAETGALLASDPWGLFAELSLSKKNNLKLPTKSTSTCSANGSKGKTAQHSMCVLSPRASLTKNLPILIEGSTKRHVRSTESINEILYSRIPVGEHTLYLNLLNTIVYDGYIVDLLRNVPSTRFCELYTYINERDVSIANWATVQDTKSNVINRNGFQSRHGALSEHLIEFKPPITTLRSAELAEQSEIVIQEAIKCLSRVQTHWERPSKPKKDDSADLNSQYIDLALISYVLSISQLGPESELNQWLQTEGKFLLNYSYQLLKTFC
ncbi:unnamed protein product [Kluyveromyces dobzhanskii CBS 2104]|uniref:WGS project CCBQ000000000 data, contig 00008 n=1 Tax=Kluyveromyces dobzhanskii CBS 2104 TaxID=1427455 RepID=A0A0A8L9D5_9SACH|nr:unnamed protein product [Kluyveromyces dobzhanskii CBS 2104]